MTSAEFLRPRQSGGESGLLFRESCGRKDPCLAARIRQFWTENLDGFRSFDQILEELSDPTYIYTWFEAADTVSPVSNKAETKTGHRPAAAGGEAVPRDLLVLAVWHKSESLLELDMIAAAETRRREGLARRLFFESLCRDTVAGDGAVCIDLEVGEHNHVARSFYESLGFQLLRRRRNYYGAGEDGLVLRREIGAEERAAFAGRAATSDSF